MKYMKLNSGPKKSLNFVFEDNFKYVRAEGGIVDKTKLNTCYIKLSTYVKHNEDEEKRTQDLKWLHYQGKKAINKFRDKKTIRPMFLCNPIIHHSFWETGRAFTQFDYTFFLEPNKTYDELNEQMIELIVNWEKEVMDNNPTFDIIKDQKEYKLRYGKGKRRNISEKSDVWS